MASPAKTASSSIPYRTSPNMKKSELCDPMRRSFSGNPFTKPSVITNPRAFNPNTSANSPSDFPRRHSTGRESVASLRDPDKENSRDQNPKPARVRSPAFSKGTKNFMSPTISAASKINASPKKKILVERNEPVRSSVSFSDVKSLIMEDKDSTQEIDLKQKKVSFSDVKSVIMEDESTPEIGLNQKKVSYFDVKSIIMDDNESTPEISLNQKKVSFADVKSVVMEDNESTPQIGLKQKNVEVPHDSESSNHEYEEPLKSNADFDYKESKNDSDSLLETVTEEKDSVNVDPNFKISPRVFISPSCPILAPLDTDPLRLPYDPKTNYLSPRPQFLHYRPNPRIELYRERDGKQLEEHFASESYSDTDVTEETQSEGLEIESEDCSSEETMKEGEEEKEELHVSESNPIAPEMVEEKYMAKRMSKPRFSTRSKFSALLLFLAFAYFSVLVANSPAFTPGLEELSLASFQVPVEITVFAKANFDRFTQNLQHWSASFLSYVSNIISSSREVQKVDPFEYANWSHLITDHISEGHQMFDHSILGPVRERDSGTEQFDDKYYGEIEADESVDEDDEQQFEEQDDQENEAYENFELVSEEEPDEVQLGIEAEMIELDHLEAEENKGVEFAAQIDVEHQSNVDLGEQPSILPHATEIQHDISKTGDPEGDGLMNSIAEIVYPEIQLGIEAEMIELDHLEAEENKGVEFAAQIDVEHQSNVDLGEQPSILPHATEIQHDISKTGDPEGDGLMNSIAEIVYPEIQLGIEAEMIELDHLEAEENKGVEFAAQIDAEHQNNVDLRDQPIILLHATEIQHDISKTGDPEGDGLMNSIAEIVFPKEVKSDNLKIEDSTDNSESSEVIDSTINGQEDQFLAKNVMGFSLLVLCLLVASAFIYTKRGKPSMPSDYSPVSGSKDTIRERLSSRNWQTEVDMTNDSCPLEISSYQRTSSSYSKTGLKESNEYQSQERKTRKTYRRESLTSSDYSTGSPSYGSFTTYEKIPSKHGGEDEEIVTPVRRSSRIKNQVTSP